MITCCSSTFWLRHFVRSNWDFTGQYTNSAQMSDYHFMLYHYCTLFKARFIYFCICIYRNHRVLQEPPQHCTRFISLANVGNPDKKQRFLYAFNITPLTSMSSSELTAQPQSSTNSPYTKSVTSYRQSQVSLLNTCSVCIMQRA